MATYILFWNPEISSYTMERFMDDFEHSDCVGNWSFHEHEKVKYDDSFYMVRCGNGRTGIVMHGFISSPCYESQDWSPKNRKNIFYADIEYDVTINPESNAVMLTPEFLTEKLPDFNWFGGHSGRRLSPAYARELDKLWAEYLNSNPQLFYNGDAILNPYFDVNFSRPMESVLHKTIPHKCEICGASYKQYLSKEEMKDFKVKEYPLSTIVSPRLNRLFFSLCYNCMQLPQELKIGKLSKK